MNTLFQADQNPLNILEQKKYNVKQTAEMLGMSVNTLNRHCATGNGPNSIMIAGQRRFLEKELERWLIDQNPQLKDQFELMESARRAMQKIRNKEAKLRAV